MKDLLPCPFCGEEADYVDCACGDFSVRCIGCNVSTEAEPFDCAADVWNKRVASNLLEKKA